MIARRARLQRYTAPQRKRSKPRRSSRVRDGEWLLAVKRLPCCAPGAPRSCEGQVEADHAGTRGLGQKCSDRQTIPLCSRHHRDRHGLTGPFRGWSAAYMRGWLDVKTDEAAVTVTAGLAGVGGVPW